MIKLDGLQNKTADAEGQLKLPEIKNVVIDDFYWNKYINLVTDVIIPYQWDILNDRLEDIETSHCIENFKIAAGLSDGDFYGAVFQDTDLAKWLEAVAYSLGYKPDPILEKQADEAIELIEKAQWEDGYINTYYTVRAPKERFSNLEEGHELYTAGHMIEAAVAYYKVTGKDRFLKVMMKFADLICDVFSDEKNSRAYPGHQEIELALIKLFEVTGRREYLLQAQRFIERRGVGDNYFLEEENKPGFEHIFPEFENYDPLYSQSHAPVKEQMSAEGHAVRATYMYAAMADLAYYMKDEAMLKACERLWKNMTEKRMYITGGIGSSGILERFTTDYDLPNDDNYSETCASIGLALFGRRMAAITHDASYYDAVERALYNVVLSGIAMDGKSFFYVNPLEVWPDNCMDRTSKEHVKPVRQEWFGVACCPPNINRTLASLAEYVYSYDEERVYINLFVSNKSDFELEGGSIGIDMETNFPFDNEVHITTQSSLEEAQLAIRVPDYVKNLSVKKDGVALERLSIINGYLMIDLEEQESKLDLHFDMPATFVYSNPQVREDIGKVAIMKGPLVYCLEEVDNGDLLSGIFVDTSKPLVETFEEKLLGGTTTVTFQGKRIVETTDSTLYRTQQPTLESVTCRAVPYPYWGNREKGEMSVWMKYLNH